MQHRDNTPLSAQSVLGSGVLTVAGKTGVINAICLPLLVSGQRDGQRLLRDSVPHLYSRFDLTFVLRLKFSLSDAE
jgi:hypothetical protein